MKRVIIDASVAAKWIFLESDSDQAESLLYTSNSFLVPEYFYIEMDSIITKKVRKRLLEPEEALMKRKQVNELTMSEIDSSVYSKLSFEIAISLSITLYDAIYLATAIKQDAILWTADNRLVRVLKRTPFAAYIENPLS